MKESKLYYNDPENPLKVSQEMCDRVHKGLKNKMEQYYKYVLPPYDAMSDVYLYKLSYLDTALELLK